MGPNSTALMARVCPDDLSPASLPFAHTREVDVGHAKVRAARMSYVGGPGYELYVPVEMTRHVYLTLQGAGVDLGLRDAGYYALDALRIERQRRAWGAEMGPDETPFEAGLWAGVKLDKTSDFKGKQALLARKTQGNSTLDKKLVKIVAKSPEHYLWGGEPLNVKGQFVGEITSAGWGYEAGSMVALGYIRGDLARQPIDQLQAQAELWGVPIDVVIHEAN
jgi:4-methylaminobutanoate oxidase (formaldehyde-forming)